MKRILAVFIILGVLSGSTLSAGVGVPGGQRPVFAVLAENDQEIFLLENGETGSENETTADTDETDGTQDNTDDSEKSSDNTGEEDFPEDEHEDDSGSEDDAFPRNRVQYPVSDDYFSTTQYSLHNIGTYMRYVGDELIEQSSVERVDLDVARGWSVYSGDENNKRPVIVAVIDSGIDYKHPDLAGRMWTNPGEIPDNGIDDDGNGYIDDVMGWDFYNNDNTLCHYSADGKADPEDCDDHGTRVAGLITAIKDNGIGIAGIASVGDVRIMSLKIHGGAGKKGTLANAVKAIKYAEQMGASVCNISWGTYSYSDQLASAIRNSKMLFVCAAGNDGTNNDTRPIYPASFGYDNIISVGFVNQNGVLSYNSNYGKNSVDIVVPATDIMSTVVGGYSSTGGSSMAAPQVSALAALIYSYSSKTWASAVRDIIVGSTGDPGDLEPVIRFPGIPSLYTALKNIVRLKEDFKKPSFTVNISYDSTGIRLDFNPHDEGRSGILKLSYMVGSHSIDDFKNGTKGLTIENNTLYLGKSGIYTFYAEDRAGNSTVKTLPILDDIVLPSILDAHFTSEGTPATIQISARVTDSHSGIRTIKYMQGRHNASDFAGTGAGTVLSADDDGIVSFAVSGQGPYTIYAADNRGNITVRTIMAYTRRSN